jgi:hypothetical protein
MDAIGGRSANRFFNLIPRETPANRAATGASFLPVPQTKHIYESMLWQAPTSTK